MRSLHTTNKHDKLRVEPSIIGTLGEELVSSLIALRLRMKSVAMSMKKARSSRVNGVCI